MKVINNYFGFKGVKFIKFNSTDLIHKYLNGKISGDGSFFDFDEIRDAISINEEELIEIVENQQSNLVFVEYKYSEIDIEAATKYIGYYSEINTLRIDGGEDIDNDIMNVNVVIDLSKILELVEDGEALLLFRVVGVKGQRNVRCSLNITNYES